MEARSFKYQLARRGKTICPNCGHRTFVLYVDEDNQPLHETVGKCDRLNNCAYHYPPHQYFADNGEDYRPTIKRRFEPTIPPIYLRKDMLVKSCNYTLEHGNNLVAYLRGVFGDELTMKMVTDYFVGTSKQFGGGSCVFFQIDRQGRIHRGKIMQYKGDGHRAKTASGNGMVNSVHSLLGISDRLPAQCLFGEHLLNRRPDAPIALFESEKTAMVASATLLGGFVCVAVGSCANLTPKMFEPLQGRNVVLFPDNGKHVEWLEKGETLRHMVGSLQISSIMEWEASNAGDDLMDWIVERYPNIPDDVDLGLDDVVPFSEMPKAL